jgi:alpha-beta hydrolase superfamily lysophospholipase
MQWGSLDNLVVREETEKVFASIASKQKKLVIYEGAMHESFLRKDPNLWQAETMGFLKANSH